MEGEEATPLHALSSAFAQSKFEACISRLYVPREQLEQAREIMDEMTENPKQQSLSFRR